VPRSGALAAAQVPLFELPDELLDRIVRRAWADRTPCPAAAEVRRAAGLACMCRRVRKLLRTQPLPLALDFSAARLRAPQRRWLLAPARAGRVQAASFHSNDSLWQRLLFAQFLARHGRTLLRLSGAPLQLVACGSQEERPAMDLSGLRLTRLGLCCNDIRHLCDNSSEQAPRVWLWPERLPGTLEELDLLGLSDEWMDTLAWAPHPGSGRRLPRLHTLRITIKENAKLLTIFNEDFLDGFASLPHIKVAGLGANMNVSINVFDRVGSVHIDAGPGGGVGVWVGLGYPLP